MVDLLQAFVAAALLVPATLLPIINPLGGAPIFLTMTGGNEQLGRDMARRVAINCFFLLVGAVLIGGYIKSFARLRSALQSGHVPSAASPPCTQAHTAA